MQLATQVVAALFVAMAASSASSQALCQAGSVPGEGIGDGCTLKYGDFNAALSPEIGLFKGAFTPACNAHDKCYTTLGTTGGQCNSNFLSDMRSACRSDFDPILRPIEFSACNNSAYAYRAGVDLYLSQMNPFPALQSSALAVSRQMEAAVKADSCMTTPERTTLYTGELISRVRTAFSAYTGRQPTVYEFLEMLNAGDLVNNQVGWESLLASYAMQKVHAPVPPLVDWRLEGKALTVTPLIPGATYQWKIDNIGTTNGPSIVVGGGFSVYDVWRPVRGYVKVTLNAGTPLEVSNVSVIDTKIFIRGRCVSGSTQLCQ